MKYLVLFAAAFCFTTSGIAQNNSRGKSKQIKQINKARKNEDSFKKDGNARTSSHQPKKVQAALLRDYPAATNVTWKKHRGDYYATFNNGVWRSTAVYHANGERRDTRTNITRDQLPGTIWEDIFKRDRITPSRFEQIERPTTAEKIYRILTGDSRQTYYYDANGNRVTYTY